MNFMAFETPQKLRGGYYTEADIAAFLTEWALEIGPKRVLEPACGDGAFFQSISEIRTPRLELVVGCEIDPVEATRAQQRTRRLKGRFELAVGDFLEWFLARDGHQRDFDAVVGNPPFIRYQYLQGGLQARAAQVFEKFGLHFTKHTNAWVPFVIGSLAMLRPGGRLAMVVPSELLHVIHARSLRQFLLQECAQVLVIDPEEIWFGDTLQGVVLLLAQKRATGDNSAPKVAITAIPNRAALKRPAKDFFARADFFPGSLLNGKWMLGLLNRSERGLFEGLEQKPHVYAFQDVASVDVGIVTGANKFFLVPDQIVKEYRLAQWAHPMFGRSEHVRGVIYGKEDHAENRRQGFPTNFLCFDNDFELTDTTKSYIRFGESQGLHRRYKCRIRSPWYSVPSVYTSPIGMLKRSHHLPRLVLNTVKAYTTDTAYRVKPAKNVKAPDLVFSFLNSVTALSAELEGRHYGGGVLELVPSEIERLLVPLRPAKPDQLEHLDKAVRDGTPAQELLAEQDALLLRPLGLSKGECTELLSAWNRLRSRRQRVQIADPAEEGQEC